MFKNYLKIAFRNLFRFKGYSFINIFGLAIGFCACIFIGLWVQNELEYNKFNENIDNMYRVLTRNYYGSQSYWGTGSPPAVGPAMKEQYPEVLNACRVQNGTNSGSLKYKDKLFKEELQMADPTVFEVFTFPLISGSYEEAFSNNYTIIISKKMAAKYFENENPIGEKLLFDNKHELKIIAIMKDIPVNSTIQFDFFVPLEILNDISREGTTSTWYNCSFNTFITLQPGTDLEQFREKALTLIHENNPDSIDEPYAYPFANEYLRLYGRLGSIITIAIIGGLILLIAIINFINLSTSFALRRAREVGLRKLIGARRQQLIIQFFMESILITFLALIVSLALAELFKPVFESLVVSRITLFTRSNLKYLLGFPLVAVIIGLLAGFYPAFVLSSFRPLVTIQRSSRKFGGRSVIRKILVTMQFVLSITLIICTIVITQQSNYLITKDLGYNKDFLVYVPLQGPTKENPELYRKKLLQNPDIQNVCFLGRNPTGIWTNGSGWVWDGKPEGLDPFVTYQGVDEHYLDTFQIEMLQGEFYSEDTDGAAGIVINESFAKTITEDNPIGMSISHYEDNFKIIGVTRDFHFKSAHNKIGALVLYKNTDNLYEYLTFRYAFMRLNSEKITNTLDYIEETTRKLTPDHPYEINFLEENVEALYRGEVQSRKMILSFCVLAVFISCLGLFGLSTLITQQRSKEIGIRKVLGSSVAKIVRLLTNQFLKWVILANVIAWPLSYYLAKSWLHNFPYQVELKLWYFLAAGFMAVLIALVTISLNTIRAANCNPVEVLKYE
ncbi:ABC transporter permease [Candidatus Cloacimonadota bacterium]